MTEAIKRKVPANEEDLNADRDVGTPGAHPPESDASAASGAVAGAVVGTIVGGPIGALIGAAAGAVAGELAGTSAAEAVNPASEELFWRETYRQEPYYVQGTPYEHYAPGFRIGWEGRVRHDGHTFEEAEPELKADYNLTKTELQPDWLDVRLAGRAAWDRVDRTWNAKQ
jgi:hypothetical protein